MKKIKSILAGAIFLIAASTSGALFAQCDGGGCGQGCGRQYEGCCSAGCTDLPCNQQCHHYNCQTPTCNWTPVQNPQCYGPCQQRPPHEPTGPVMPRGQPMPPNQGTSNQHMQVTQSPQWMYQYQNQPQSTQMQGQPQYQGYQYQNQPQSMMQNRQGSSFFQSNH